jgi:GDPmannose 4,6-dehydratase
VKRALITGVTGQDGSYLAELLLEKGYEVHGMVRPTSRFNRARIEHLIQDPELKGTGRFTIHYGDMTDGSSLLKVLAEVRPDEIYNLAAQSHVQVSFQEPEYTAQSDAVGVLRILELVRGLGMSDYVRIYQASTSELYGDTPARLQNENVPFQPVSPYAAAKLYAYYICQSYKKAYDMYVCNGILFNHESPRRGENFVTRKITLSLAEVLAGRREHLTLGNLDAQRDWGYAGDYVEAMWLMLQQPEPKDYVIATGETRSVRDFVEHACELCGFNLEWTGDGVEERGVDARTGKTVVRISPEYFRPVEVPYLRGDPSKAMAELGWRPRTRFEDLVRMMLASDLEIMGVEVPFRTTAVSAVTPTS